MAVRPLPPLSDRAAWAQRLVAQTDDVLYVYQLDPSACLYISPAITALTGLTPDEIYESPAVGRTVVHPGDLDRLAGLTIGGASVSPVDLRLRHRRTGMMCWVEMRGTIERDAGGTLVLHGSIRNITDRKRAEETIGRLARFYAALSETNQVIIRCRTEAELFPELCRIAVKHGGLIGAWIGIVDPATARVVPRAGHGLRTESLERLDVSIDPARPEGQGPIGTAIREGRPRLVPDFLADRALLPWRSVAIEIGVRSSAAIPIRRAGQVIGAFNLYAGEIGFFDDELLALLGELADDISYALDTFDREAQHAEAEERLRESETKFRVLFESARDAIFLMDGAHFVECNPRTLEFFGHTHDEMMGRSPVAFSPARQPDGERSTDKAARYIEAAYRGEPQRFEWRHLRREGQEYDAEVTLNRVELGGRVFLQSIVHDITDRKLSEARTAQQALRYHSLMQAALDGIHILDSHGALVEANDRFFELLGYDPQKRPRLHVTDWDGQWSSNELISQLPDDLRRAQTFETVHRRADGTTLPVEVSAVGIDLGGEQVLYCASRDISARKDAEEERVSLQRALLQAQKMESVGRLAGGVAHDFNNLLTVIAGYASLLEADTAESPALAARAAEIIKATARATELTRNLLIFSRRHPDEPKIIVMDDILLQEARVVPRLIGEHIAVVPSPGAAGVRVRIDPAQLAQVLMNLVVNARDAMPEGGTLILRTSLRRVEAVEAAQRPGARPGEYVCLGIADTGCGMSAAIQAHLFEPFFTTKEIGKGTGLGLATVYGIVQQAGGFIDVRSAPNQGTTMNVLLPVTTAEATSTVAESVPTVVGGRERVLIVEDESTVRELTRTILVRLGYTVLEAASPAEALAIVRAGARFDVMVTDVVMPGMNGHRLVEELAKIRQGFKILYVSGFADTGVAATTDVTADHAHFLAKPFSPQALGHKLREILDRPTT